MTRRDGFEGMVRKEYGYLMPTPLKLLRQYHNKIVRMVQKKAVDNLKWKPLTSFGHAIKASLASEYRELLAALATLRQGGPR